MRVVGWPEFMEKWPIDTLDRLYLNLNLFDIPDTITAAIRQLTKYKNVIIVSVHESCQDAAKKGQVNNRPIIVTRPPGEMYEY